MPDFLIGSVGVPFYVELVGKDGEPFDLSGSTEIRLFFVHQPKGIVFSRVAEVTEEPGVVVYYTQAGDFEVNGNWRVQARITKPTGVFQARPQNFSVGLNNPQDV
jgi:hypothetical protein